MAERESGNRRFKYQHKKHKFADAFNALRDEPILMEYFFNPHLPNLPYENFPDNIEEWIWSSCVKGTYRLFCRLKTGLYAYFEARRGYTGYDYHDTMRISVTATIREIVDYCMTDKVYITYIEDTVPLISIIAECSDEEDDEKDEKSVVFTPTRADYDTVDGIPSPKPFGNPYRNIIHMISSMSVTN